MNEKGLMVFSFIKKSVTYIEKKCKIKRREKIFSAKFYSRASSDIYSLFISKRVPPYIDSLSFVSSLSSSVVHINS